MTFTRDPHTAGRSSSRVPRWRCAAASAAAALCLLSVVPAAAQPKPSKRVLVMPFDSGRDARAWWLGEGAAVLLADSLRARGADAINRDERLRAFARLQVPAVATLSHGTVIRVGQLLGASAVVFGTVALEGTDTLVVRARNLRLDSGRLQDEVEERGSLTDLFAVFDRVAGRIAPAAAGVASAPGVAGGLTPAAFENYIKGLLADTPSSQIGFLDKAIALSPKYDRPRLALWRVYTDQGEHEKALAAALAVPDASDYAVRARFAAALSEIALRRYDEAYGRLKALAERTNAPEAFNDVGVIQVQRGSTPQTGKATWWFTRAAHAGTADPDYYFNLGYAYWLEQDAQAAIYWLREAVRRDPGDGDAHFVLAAALQAVGSAVEADREAELARRLSERWERADRRAGVPRGLERLKTIMEPPGAAPELALEATEQRDQRELAAFHLERGRRLFDHENDREAVAELKRALYLSPYLADAHQLLGRAYLRDGRTQDAIEALKIALWSQETAETHLALAEAYLQARDVEHARQEAGRAVALDPSSQAGREFLQKLPSTP